MAGVKVWCRRVPDEQQRHRAAEVGRVVAVSKVADVADAEPVPVAPLLALRLRRGQDGPGRVEDGCHVHPGWDLRQVGH